MLRDRLTAMRGIRHPLTDALYELDGDGHVLVTTDTTSGTFTFAGEHVAGELRHADPHMCVWLTAEAASNRYRTDQ
jgi:hypothetical protein